MSRPYWLIILTAVCALVLTAASVHYRQEGRAELLEEAAASARLYVQAIRAEVDRRRHLPEVLASSDDFVAVAKGGDATAVNDRLREIVETTEAEAVYLMDRSGLTVAASNWDQKDGFLGERYEFRDYFRSAMRGQAASEFAIGATTGRPGLFISHPVEDGAEGIVGALVVKIDMASLTAIWESGDDEILLLNADGVVVIAERQEWLYRSTRPLSDAQRDRIAARRQFAGRDLALLDLDEGAEERVVLDGTGYLRVAAPVGLPDWQVWLLAPERQVWHRALPSLANVAVVLLLAIAAFFLVRSERFRSALTLSQQERSELTRLNRELNNEIEERKAAEAGLRNAESELRRSAKMAALGQLAASVTHELGQPLSAMKTHVRGAQRDLARGSAFSPVTLERLDRLVDRIVDIAQQLRFFARRGGEPMRPVDLREVVAGASETMEPAFQSAGARLEQQLPDAPVLVEGGQRRLEQVLVNLIRNALDAMAERDDPLVTLSLTNGGREARIRVRDRGHGIAPEISPAVFEPFATTRASGEGMGLGLAISASIVQEHAGRIEAANLEGGGAEFVVTLPLLESRDGGRA